MNISVPLNKDSFPHILGDEAKPLAKKMVDAALNANLPQEIVLGVIAMATDINNFVIQASEEITNLDTKKIIKIAEKSTHIMVDIFGWCEQTIECLWELLETKTENVSQFQDISVN